MTLPAIPPPLPADPATTWELDPAVIPELDGLVTQTEEPVDNIATEKQQRLLADAPYSSWGGPGQGRPFLVLVNVGWFYASRQPPVVPDCLLSLGVTLAGDLDSKEGRSYFQWLYGKPPDLVIEIVSDRRGGEEDDKWQLYVRQGVRYYIIFDPRDLLGGGVLRAYALNGDTYTPIDPKWLPGVGLGLTLWEGKFEACERVWLRWCDEQGRVVPTGAERADQAEEHIKRLAARLRELGIDPEA